MRLWQAGLPARASVGAAVFLSIWTALAGPVLVYREGRFCPKDRAPDAPRISSEQAVERARQLLPAEFCAPNWYVDGCDFEPELAFDTWRVYAHQYKVIEGRHHWAGRDHSYIVLDAIGNCMANIPGT